MTATAISISTEQRVRQVIQAVDKNVDFLILQSRDQLITIKLAMERQALEQKDLEKKQKMRLYAQQARQMLDHKQNKAKEKIERINLIHQIRQGASEITTTQKTVMAIVVLLTGLLAYFQNNQRKGWFTTAVIACFFVFLVIFIGVIAYNCFCRRKIEQKQFLEINEDENMLNSSPQNLSNDQAYHYYQIHYNFEE